MWLDSPGVFATADGFTYDFGAHFITNRLAAALGIRPVPRHPLLRRGVLLGGRLQLPLRAPRRSFCSGPSRPAVDPAAPPAHPPPPTGTPSIRRPAGRAGRHPPGGSVVGRAGGRAGPVGHSPQVDRGTAHVLGLRLASRLSGRAVANGYSREKPESPHVWHVYPSGSLGLL